MVLNDLSYKRVETRHELVKDAALTPAALYSERQSRNARTKK
jgi:hypothetical protein